MKKLFIAVAILSAVSAAHAAPNPSPSAYDRLQDIEIKSNTDFNDIQQKLIVKNESDIRDLTNNTQRQFDQVNKYADSVQQQSAQHDAAQDQTLAKQQGQIDGVKQQAHDAWLIAGQARQDAQRANDRLDNLPVPKDGKDGKDGIDGTNGTDGTNGKDGVDGKNGLDGAKGDKGDAGAAGRDGADGKDGLNGKDADMTVVNANTAGVKSLQQRAADLDIRIAQQKADQAKTNSTVAAHTAQLADHEKRISSLESQTNARFGDLKNQIDDNKRNADAGIAGVAAMANIPQVTESQTFAVGAGVGTREGESAIAVGFSARASQNVVVKASVAGDTQQSWTVGAGVSYGW